MKDIACCLGHKSLVEPLNSLRVLSSPSVYEPQPGIHGLVPFPWPWFLFSFRVGLKWGAGLVLQAVCRLTQWVLWRHKTGQPQPGYRLLGVWLKQVFVVGLARPGWPIIATDPAMHATCAVPFSGRPILRHLVQGNARTTIIHGRLPFGAIVVLVPTSFFTTVPVRCTI